jgi:hypothetical protein
MGPIGLIHFSGIADPAKFNAIIRQGIWRIRKLIFIELSGRRIISVAESVSLPWRRVDALSKTFCNARRSAVQTRRLPWRIPENSALSYRWRKG